MPMHRARAMAMAMMAVVDLSTFSSEVGFEVGGADCRGRSEARKGAMVSEVRVDDDVSLQNRNHSLIVVMGAPSP